MIQLGKNQYPQGAKNSIQYFWDFGKFEIRTYEKNYVVTDSEIETRAGKFYFNPSKQNPKYTFAEIEIPENVIERKYALNHDRRLRKESIANIDHKNGNIYFSLNAEGQIIAKCGCKTAVSDMEIIENKNAINIEPLGLSVPYIEVPPEVETAYVKANNIKIMESVRLIYAGKSLLTGQEYHKLNKSVPMEEWEKVESSFENFGTCGSGLRGWLTSQPEKVQKLLGLKPTEGNREHEDDVKQFEDAITLLETAK